MLKARDYISVEYDLRLNEEGEYVIEASFPYAEVGKRRFTVWARLVVEN